MKERLGILRGFGGVGRGDAGGLEARARMQQEGAGEGRNSWEGFKRSVLGGAPGRRDCNRSGRRRVVGIGNCSRRRSPHMSGGSPERGACWVGRGGGVGSVFGWVRGRMIGVRVFQSVGPRRGGGWWLRWSLKVRFGSRFEAMNQKVGLPWRVRAGWGSEGSEGRPGGRWWLRDGCG